MNAPVDRLEAEFGGASEPEWHAPDTTASRLEAGRKLRKCVPRRSLAELLPHERDPLGILNAQNATRLQEFVPLRTERMSQNPFAFYRGTAAIMASDLAAHPHTGILVPSCGDAHLSNFGFYASPQRTLVFDLNDFDEAAWAPWEWDLKRLLTSVIVAGRATARDEEVIRSAVLSTVREYATAMRAGVTVSPLERYYAHLDAENRGAHLPRQSQAVLRKAIKQARRRTGDRAVQRLTTTESTGRRRFVERPPTMTALAPELARLQHDLMHRYLDSAAADIQLLLRGYTISDSSRRIVGVGSVGTRCSLTLLQDGDGHALILQAKEARRSVLEEHGGISQPRRLQAHIERHGEGARVVAMQRILQALSDPFLGYLRTNEFELYVRQFHDMKGGLEAETLDDEPFKIYAQACGVTLARAHLQSPLAGIISGYIGSGRTIGEALLEWGCAYASLSENDYERFLSAQQLAARMPR